MAEVRKSDATDRARWKTAALFLITLALVATCGLLIYPFAPAITGAIVLAVVTRRPYQWWRSKIRNRNVAATTSLLLVTLSIIGPVLLLVQYLVRHAINGAEMLRDGRAQRLLDALMERFPQLARTLENSSDFITLEDALHRAAGFVASHLVGLLSNSVAAAGQIVIMLFLLFFLYRDEDVSMGFLRRLLPLSEAETNDLLRRFADTIHATVLGRLVVASVQGTVAGGVFALLGVHTAVMLGLLTATAGLVPPFGAYLVWLPVAAWFAITGHWIKMAVLLAVGSLIISTLDNFLYPILVGSHLRQHTMSVFLSLLGGIWLFGISGLVLGPLLFTATEALLTIWRGKANPAPIETPG
ncbi:MAG: AI-2E family transporter [Acidobacteriota bacterium]